MIDLTTRAEEGARAIRNELLTYAGQLRRMETQAGMGGPELSVRVKDPDWLIRLMTRAASALEVRRAEAAEARAASAEAEVERLKAELDDVRHQCCALRAKRGRIGPELWGKHPSTKRWERIADGSNTDERVADFEECYRAAGWTNLQRWSPFNKVLDAASASALRDRVAVLESALRSLEESLRPAERVPFVDPAHGAAVEALGHRIGFGALMSSASASWAAIMEATGTPGGEFVSGPCRAVLQADLRAARAALKESTHV